MLPQLGRLNLSSDYTPIKRAGSKPRSPLHHRLFSPKQLPNPTSDYCSNSTEITSSDSPGTSSSSDSEYSSEQIHKLSRYVVFRNKSQLFMPSPSSTEPIYARIDDSWLDSADKSTDSGFSDRPEIYEKLENLTDDDISLLSQYQRVLKNRTKKSRFKRLSDFLCTAGNNSDDEMEDSLYDSLESGSSFSSPTEESSEFTSFSRDASSCGGGEQGEEADMTSPTDDSLVRFNRRDFFHVSPPKREQLYSMSTNSEYVFADQLQKTPKQKAVRRKAQSYTSPLCHDYENVRDFTKPRKSGTGVS